MELRLKIGEESYTIDTHKAIHLGIPLRANLENQPNAFYAPPYDAYPLKAGDFVGSTEQGAPVNFYNVVVNPHGNGTHTECIGHIQSGAHYITKTLQHPLVIAELVSVLPTRVDNGDRQVRIPDISALTVNNPEALIVRTVPNDAQKLNRHYSGTNPPYFDAETMRAISESTVVHLLTDLPSVDREEDDGALINHRLFWQLDGTPRLDRTITEMLFIDNEVEDGLYLLDIQIAPFELDASPSNPVIYKLNSDREN